MSSDAPNGGAYRLHLRISRAAWIEAGRLGRWRLLPGNYLYVGSARTNLAQRVARHVRLATEKEGRRHWHIDGVLLHRYARLVRAEALPGATECDLAHELLQQGAGVPIPGFGATDCRTGCPAHFFSLSG